MASQTRGLDCASRGAPCLESALSAHKQEEETEVWCYVYLHKYMRSGPGGNPGGLGEGSVLASLEASCDPQTRYPAP